eukprot:gene7110-46725_t
MDTKAARGDGAGGGAISELHATLQQEIGSRRELQRPAREQGTSVVGAHR